MDDVLDWIGDQLVRAEQAPYAARAPEPADGNGGPGRLRQRRSWRLVVGTAEAACRGPRAWVVRVRSGSWARWAVVGTVAVAASIGALVLGTNGGGPPSAFAGWSATPTPAAADQLQAAEGACEQLASAPAALSARARALTWSTPTLADTRGPFTLLFYAASSGTLSCIAGWPSGGVAGHGWRYPVTPAPAPAPDTISAVSGESSGPQGQLWSQLQGQVGSDVTAVTVVLGNGGTVRATVGDSWFVAWWPGGQDAKSARITTVAGTTTQPLGTAATLRLPATSTTTHATGTNSR
jgi:hypothetical protein